MKRTLGFSMILVVLAMSAAGCSVVIPRADSVTLSATLTAPPQEVYHEGRILRYRDDGYYYHREGVWLVAPSVPHHVSRYHQPRAQHVRRSPARPVHRRYY